MINASRAVERDVKQKGDVVIGLFNRESQNSKFQ